MLLAERDQHAGVRQQYPHPLWPTAFAQRSTYELTLRGLTVPHLTKDLRKLSEAWAWVYASLSISLQNLAECYHKDGPLSYSKALNRA